MDKVTTNFKQKLENIAVSLLFIGTPLFFVPLELFTTNSSEFILSTSQLILFALAITIIGTIITSLILIYFKRAQPTLVIILLVLGLFCWYQSMFGWDKGPLNGVNTNSPDTVKVIIQTMVILIALIIAILNRRRILPYAAKIAGIVIIAQIINIVFLIINIPEEPLFKSLESDDSNKFSFSAQEKNVIVLILDTFQTDVFKEIIDERPEYKDMLKGFTYFPNNLAGYPTTYASVSLALTGNYYQNEKPIQSFIKESFTTNSLPKTFKAAGYDVYLPLNPTLYSTPEIASNYKIRQAPTNWQAISSIYSLGTLKLLPESIKSLMSNTKKTNIETVVAEAGSLFDYNVDFVNSFESQVNTQGNQPTFKFYHLRGAHAPFTLNEHLQYEEMPFDRSSFKRQSIAALQTTQRLLKRLETLGIYNNTAIVILGDHGNGLTPEGFAESTQNNKFQYKIDNAIKFAARPLLLIKDFNNQGPLSISDKATTLGDIPKSVAGIAQLQTSFPGIDVLHEEASSERTRNFFFYEWKGKWKNEYLPEMKKFLVKGNAFDNSSWINTYTTYTNTGHSNDLPPLALSTPYKFNSATKSTRLYLQEGWGEAEEAGTWSVERFSSLLIPVTKDTNDISINLKLRPFVTSKQPKQQIRISINNTTLAEGDLTNEKIVPITIPKEHIENNRIKLVFELPDAISPQQLGISGDSRNLGIMLETIRIDEVIPYEYGKVLKFTKAAENNTYLTTGWSTAEDELTWSDGNEATILIPVRPADRELFFSADITPFLSNPNLLTQSIQVSVNNVLLTTWEARNSGTFTFSIPKEMTSKETLAIKFILPNATSPQKLNISADQRKLGIGLKSLFLTQKQE